MRETGRTTGGAEPPDNRLQAWMKAYARPVELVATIAGVIFIAVQTWQLNQSIQQIKQSYFLDAFQVVQSHKQRINEILVGEPGDLSQQVFGTPKSDIVKFMLINDYDGLVHMRCNGLIGDDIWPDVERMIFNTLRAPNIKPFWLDHQGMASPLFQAYASKVVIGADRLVHNQEQPLCDRQREELATGTGEN